jgi:hypothetical protein
MNSHSSTLLFPFFGPSVSCASCFAPISSYKYPCSPSPKGRQFLATLSALALVCLVFLSSAVEPTFRPSVLSPRDPCFLESIVSFSFVLGILVALSASSLRSRRVPRPCLSRPPFVCSHGAPRLCLSRPPSRALREHPRTRLSTPFFALVLGNSLGRSFEPVRPVGTNQDFFA